MNAVLGRTLVLHAGLALVMFGLWNCGSREWSNYICFHCRCSHSLGTVAGISYKDYRPSGLTRWVAREYPGHYHQWLHTGNYSGGLLGMSQRGVGGSFRSVNPMWNLTVDEQLEFLRNADPVRTCRFVTLTAEHRQRQAVNLVLNSQQPPRALCFNTWGTGDCDGRILPLPQAVAATVGNEPRLYCSEKCREQDEKRGD